MSLMGKNEMSDIICAYEKCRKKGRYFGCGKYLEGKGHPKPNYYCLKHFPKVINEGNPEYVANCPNCDCGFGVN